MTYAKELGGTESERHPAELTGAYWIDMFDRTEHGCPWCSQLAEAERKAAERRERRAA